MRRCIYLSCYDSVNAGWSVASCRLNASPYIPSVQELERYCKTGQLQQCPVFSPSSFEEFCFSPELAVVALARSR
jgi:hypothetical protein